MKTVLRTWLVLAILGTGVGAAAAFPDSPRTVLVAASNASAADKAVAQYVCTGTNDEAVINQAIASLTKGGTVQLSDGDFYIDAFPNEGNSAIYFGYNNGVARAVTLRGGTQNKSYNTRLGTGIHVTERAVQSMTPGTVYRAIYGAAKTPPAPGDFFTMTYVNNVVFEQFYLLFHDASKSWHGIDGGHFGNMRITLVGVYTERYFQDRFLHVRPSNPVPGSVGIMSVNGSNDEMSDVGYEKVNVGGMHTGFFFQGVDHLVLTACSAARCCYGYHFKGYAAKTLTLLNCCDEGNTHLPYFEGIGHLTAIDFNIERFNAAFIPLSTDENENALTAEAFEKDKGGWHGFISYTMQGEAFGLKKLWNDGSGVNFRTINLDHDLRSRPAHPEPGETYYDAPTRRTLTWDVATQMWVDALGRPADEPAEPVVLAYWPFGESKLRDVSGNGHTLEGGADLSGDAAVLGGTAATVLSTVDTLDLSPYSVVTVEFFAKVTNTPHRVYFLEHTESMNANIGGFHINLNERDAGEYRIGALMKTTSAELGIACVDTAEGPLQDGKWHHVAVVLKCNKTTSYRAADPADWCISVWVDGTVVQRSGHRMDTLANTNPSCTFRNAKLYLGSRANSEGFLTGEIDDVRITAGSLAPNDFLKKRTALPGTTAILR